MLEILGAEVFDLSNLNHKKRKYNKTQILLYDTKRRIDDFIKMLKYRREGKYEDIPHFCITKTGKIYKLIEPDYMTKTFGDTSVDKKQIKIAIENLGWLNKNTIMGTYSNWINDIYRGEPHLRGWRGYFYWDTYSKEQLNALADLCLLLCAHYDIPYQSVPSSGFFENAKNFNGIVSKSNFSDIYTDINPSFNFNIFEENVSQTEPRI
jgi:N-acetyl-anhydromuramyl-L-alanine amidase AmpD